MTIQSNVIAAHNISNHSHLITRLHDDDTCTTDTAIATESSSADQALVFAAEITKATQKLPVITTETLNISLKDFAALVVEEGAPYSYQR